MLSFCYQKGMLKNTPFDNQEKLIMHYSVYEKEFLILTIYWCLSTYHLPLRGGAD